MRLTIALGVNLVALHGLAAAPPEPATLHSETVVGLRSYFRNVHSAPVLAYANAGLAARVCPVDKVAAENLFLEAIRGLKDLPDSAFSDASDILPVTSFPALYHFIAGGVKGCNPKLLAQLATDAIRTRLENARLQAAANLTAAQGLVDENPDRAAQLMAATLGAVNPEELDLRTFVSLLCRLRERAPDLADDLFEQALDLDAGATVATPAAFDELARYLFVAETYRERPDKQGLASTYEVGGVTFTDLAQVRHSSNPDEVLALLTTSANVLKDNAAVTQSPIVAYALAYQLLPRTRELAPELTSTFEELLNNIGLIASTYTGQVLSALSAGGGAQSADADVDPDRKRDRHVTKVQAAWKAKQFDAAKDAVHPIDDLSICSQLESLIDFGRGAEAAERKDTGAALGFAGGLRQGTKRAILYAAIAAAEKDRDIGLDITKLAVRDAEVLPPEFRASLLMAITRIVMKMDQDRGYASLSRAVVAFNDASLKPRQTIFDPRKARKALFNPDIDASTDAPFILHTRKGFYEVVDSEFSRHNFPLRAAGVDTFDLQTVLASLNDADPERLGSIAVEIRNETQRVSAVLGVADLMIRKLRSAATRVGPG